MRSLSDIMASVPKLTHTSTPGWNVDDNKFNIISAITARSNIDFKIICEHVLGNKDLAPFHMEPVKYIYDSKFILIIWPRGHLKTTIWDEDYLVWRMWKERNIELATVSSALEQSQKTIENIQRLIEDNEFLKDLIPKDKSETWNKSQINTSNGNRLYQKPYNSTSRGMHVDYLVLDDILREEKLSQEQIKEYFWSIFYPTVQTRRGKIIMIGTPMTTKDLFADLSKMPDVKTIKKACVEVDDKGAWKEPIWPQNFSLEQLNSIKANQGTLVFEREYMCNPLGGGSNIFKNINIGKHKEINKPIPTEEYYMGVDVAMASGTTRDFTVFSLLGLDGDTGLIKQRRMERYKGWNEDMIIKRTEELCNKFNIKKVLIENIGLSIGIVDKMEKEKRAPVEGFLTNRTGKEELISSIAVGFETNVLEILDNTIQYNELLGFKAKEDDRSGKMTYEGVGEHDDTVIALGLAMLAIHQDEKGASSIAFI